MNGPCMGQPERGRRLRQRRVLGRQAGQDGVHDQAAALGVEPAELGHPLLVGVATSAE